MRALILLLFLMLPAAAKGQEAAPVNVVATFSILGDVVKNVGKDKVAVSVLVGPNGDTHTFEPTPKDNVLLANAQIVFENGIHFESWLDKLYEASGSKAMRVVTSDGVELNADDPHIWQDVTNMLVVTERVRDALMQVDQPHADYYRRNAEAYLDKLGALNLWIIDTLKDIPDEERQLVTSHDALGYFAKRYGFKVIGTAIASATSEAQDPSAADIAKLFEQIKASGIKVVFMESGRNNKLMKTLAKDAGVSLAPELYTDALGVPGSEGDTYIKMMQHNAGVFAAALNPDKKI